MDHSRHTHLADTFVNGSDVGDLGTPLNGKSYGYRLTEIAPRKLKHLPSVARTRALIAWFSAVSGTAR